MKTDLEMINDKKALDKAQRLQASRAEFLERMLCAVPEDGRVEPWNGLMLHRSSNPTEALHSVSYPCLCVLAQGSKEIHLGEKRYQYDPYHYLLVTAELPIAAQILEASKTYPYLSLVLKLDPTLVSSVMIETGGGHRHRNANQMALDVSPLGVDLLDAVLRLVRLIDAPDEQPILEPLITREIIFRLLKGEQGERLRHIAVLGGQSHRISRALKRLHTDFDQFIRIEALAEDLGMSLSSLHHHFKAVTGMSPLQFQKQLRLQEARRLMLGEDVDAATAGYRVGYDNASHFSREYKKLFGQPPIRDVERLRDILKEDVVH